MSFVREYKKRTGKTGSYTLKSTPCAWTRQGEPCKQLNTFLGGGHSFRLAEGRSGDLVDA